MTDRITPAPYRNGQVTRPSTVLPEEATPIEEDFDWTELTPWEKVQVKTDEIVETIKWGALLSPYILRTTVGIIMKNWKTTVGAILGAIALVLDTLGIIELSQEFISAMTLVIVTIIGFFAADAQKQ